MQPETTMPTLRDPRREAFAQARAKGALLIDAYESAGFVRHRGHPSRLALKEEVAERIAELRALQTEIEDVSPLPQENRGVRLTTEAVVEREGSDKPVCIAELIGILIPPR